MALKLLTPGEAADKHRKSEAASKHRVVEIQGLIVAKLKELGEVEKTFDDALQKQRNMWAAEQMEHEARIVGLSKQVDELEERKKQALLPLTAREKELDTKASALDARETQLNLREADIAERTQLLATKLDEVSERELQADRVGKLLQRKEEGITAQSSQVNISSAALTVAMQKAATEATDREHQLELRQVTLKAKESSLEERERKVNEKVADFDRREAALKDERIALTAAAQELEKLYGMSKLP